MSHKIISSKGLDLNGIAIGQRAGDLITTRAMATGEVLVGRTNSAPVPVALLDANGRALTGVTLMQFSGVGVTGGVTVYLGHGFSVTEAVVNFYLPVAGVITRLTTAASAFVGAGETYTYTVRVSAVDTAITHAVTGAGGQFGTSTGAVPVGLGSLISVKLVTSALAATATHTAMIVIQVTG